MLFDYDKNNADSILNYAKKLENMTFKDVLSMYQNSPYKTYDEYNQYKDSDIPLKFEENETPYTANTNAKGQLGCFLEEKYFGYKPNSEQAADFKSVGIEVKSTPIDIGAKGQYRAGERLSITNISYTEPVQKDFYQSHVWEKIKRILLIHYIRDKSKERYDYLIKYVTDFTIPYEDLLIIIQDYDAINRKIEAGKANEISEGDTLYLGACTKGKTAKDSLSPQYYNRDVLAKKRNYCLKQSYMNFVLQNYILNKENYESIIKSSASLTDSFEHTVLSMLKVHVGKTDEQLCKLYNRPYNNNKAQWSDLTYRMLDIKGNHAEEFVKAGIVVKEIRLEENGKMRECMSFPTFKFLDLAKETWEESTLFNYFDTTKFLFVIYKKEGNHYKLYNAKFWNMPYEDLNVTVKSEWQQIQNIIINGVEFTNKNGKIKNNLPAKSNTEIIHIRPHAAKSAYKLNDGTEIGDIQKNANQLPNGEYMTTQCFWLNNSYIEKQLELV